MKIDASPETIRAVAAVLQRAAFLDDRIGQPDKARIMAWAEQIERFKFSQDDMLDGLQLYYEGASDRAIGIGDLIECASQARRNRVAKEDRESREARQAILDAKAEPDPRIVALAESMGIPDDAPRFSRSGMNSPKGIDCPWCKAKVLQPCVDPVTGVAMRKTPFHHARTEAWEKRSA